MYQVIVGNELTERFEIKKGVRQGCPLSPILFNIYINDLGEALRRKGESGSVLGTSAGVKVFNLLYADDAKLIAEDVKELAKMLKTLNGQAQIRWK